MISVSEHKAVVIVDNGAVVYGFPHIYSAVAFIERQVTDSDKAFNAVLEVINEELELDGHVYKLMDVSSYFDVYTDDESEEDNE